MTIVPGHLGPESGFQAWCQREKLPRFQMTIRVGDIVLIKRWCHKNLGSRHVADVIRGDDIPNCVESLIGIGISIAHIGKPDESVIPQASILGSSAIGIEFVGLG